jgi:AmmeMemoRadiSam system protein B
MTAVRQSKFAGSFYPKDQDQLLQEIKGCFMDNKFGIGEDFSFTNKKNGVLGGIVPHAGYKFSCSATTHTIQDVFSGNIPDTVIILGFHHDGFPKNSLMTEGSWKNPIGTLDVDSDLANEIKQNLNEMNLIELPERNEHSIEVELPFISYVSQKVNKPIKIVPISVESREIGRIEKIADGISKSIENKNVKILASTDLSHEPDITNQMHKKSDAIFIDAFESGDWKEVFNKGKQTTMGGYHVASLLMKIGNNLGYDKPQSLKSYNSCEKQGKDYCNYTVGYFSGVMKK